MQRDQDIPNRRRPKAEITPLIEDAGLFRYGLQDVAVELMPVLERTSRGDLMIRGIARPEKEVEVIFAGRRLSEAADLYERMKQLGQARGPRARFQLNVRGNWRLRFVPDWEGWEVKSYQLLAAQWAYLDEEGEPVHFGYPPVVPQKRLEERARAARAVQHLTQARRTG